MLSRSIASLLSFLLAFIHIRAILALPFEGLGEEARSIISRATPAAPHFVAYSDEWISGENGPPATSSIAGYNVFVLSFLLQYGPADQAQEWASLTASQRSTIKSQYAAAGISLVVSLFGSTETPTSSGYDPVDTANTMAAWVKQYDLDGVDVDYEDFNAFDAGNGDAENWVISFTQQLRTQLPQGQFILTHAPVAPWFSPSIWGGGGYLKIHQTVGSLIDWYNIQFYNQGTSDYTTCTTVLTQSTSDWPKSSIFEIAASGVTLDKLVIGKPGTTSDANNGYIAPATLATCVQQAVQKGWDAGVSVWEYPDAPSAWIETVRSLAFPVSGAPPPAPTTTSSASPPSSTGGSGSCAGVAAWNSASVYVGGDEATYQGSLWTAKWWTEDDIPGGAAGVWTKGVAC